MPPLATRGRASPPKGPRPALGELPAPAPGGRAVAEWARNPKSGSGLSSSRTSQPAPHPHLLTEGTLASSLLSLTSTLGQSPGSQRTEEGHQKASELRWGGSRAGQTPTPTTAGLARGPGCGQRARTPVLRLRSTLLPSSIAASAWGCLRAPGCPDPAPAPELVCAKWALSSFPLGLGNRQRSVSTRTGFLERACVGIRTGPGSGGPPGTVGVGGNWSLLLGTHLGPGRG